MENELEQWLQHATDDMNSALFLQNMYPKPLEIICFHLQQSAEKYLKAFLFANGVEPPKIHDLRVLCNLCIEIADSFTSLYASSVYLNPFGVQPRYPNEIIINEDILAHAINCAKNVQNFPQIAALREANLPKAKA